MSLYSLIYYTADPDKYTYLYIKSADLNMMINKIIRKDDFKKRIKIDIDEGLQY